MVAVNDRVKVWSERVRAHREATVLSPRSDGYWLIQYDNGEMATKLLDDRNVIVDKPAPVTNEYEVVKETAFVVVVNGEMTEFGSDELEAAKFALRAYRRGDKAHVFERKTIESFRVVDPE